MPDQVVVFVDAQNMYQGARRAFFPDPSAAHISGNFNPRQLGQLLASRPRPGGLRELQEVRIYTGRPDATKQAKTYAAHMRQCAAWNALGKVAVIPRPLRYPRQWPDEREREKGIDVALAIDFVAMAIDKLYDIGILVSTDTDLLPALEYVARKVSLVKAVEVASWQSATYRNRLRVKGIDIWCHLLQKADYDSISDLTDYRP